MNKNQYANSCDVQEHITPSVKWDALLDTSFIFT